MERTDSTDPGVVSALAARVKRFELHDADGHAEPDGEPFRRAAFDDASAAVSAALLLIGALPHAERAGIAIAIAHGEADAARTEADRLAAHAGAGTIVLTATAMEALGRRLPDGMALRPEQVEIDGRSVTVFGLRGAAEVIDHALPTPGTPLVGRTADLRALRALLATERLVTLTGPPGSGKTRLAVATGWSALGEFPDGAWFASLAPIKDEHIIANVVARTLGLVEQPGKPMREVVRDHVRGRHLLLILDNLEHVLGGADVVADWLAGGPDLRVISTSREPLHLSGEREFAVAPLPVPRDPDDPRAAEAEAVVLFAQRAQAVDASFQLDPDSLADVARICQRLDGLPLAVELAAARAKALPAASILERLERNMELLVGSARDAPDRHRSLRAAVSWSHDLLSVAEQQFFRRLSVFRGGWTLEAAELVTGTGPEQGRDVLALTASLLDKSLLRRQPDARAEPRYDMLAVIREFAAEQLEAAGESEPTAERQATWLLGLAEEAAPRLTGGDSGPWLDRLEREVNNFRTALRWAIVRRQAELGMRMAAALWRFWQVRAHIGEGRQVLDELLGLGDAVNPIIRARALSAAGSLAYWQNDGPTAVRRYEEAVELARSVGDREQLASSLYDLGHALSVLEPVMDCARGRDLEVEALEIYRSLGSATGEAWLVWALGNNSHFAGDHARAVDELAKSIELFRSLGDVFGLAWALTQHGLAAAANGQPEVAESSWSEALRIFGDAGDLSGIDSTLEHLAHLARSHGDARRAITLAAAAGRARGISQSKIAEMTYGTAGVGSEDIGLSLEEIDHARRAGEAMTTDEAVAYALAEVVRPAMSGLRVSALGPMQVERDGSRIRRWGGDKAGSRQAQALFAFLFDRGAVGLEKDEVTELLWPELAIRRGDLAFHRTLGGLRSVLDAGRPSADSVTYEGGRYRLASDIVGWSDVNRFEELLGLAAAADGSEAIDLLEEARGLYRGDLFDDCPSYGDSAYVEERREFLRGRFEDVLVELGDRYAAIDDRSAAAARYRQALTKNPDNARARTGLARLGSTDQGAAG